MKFSAAALSTLFLVSTVSARFVGARHSKRVSYDGYQVVRLPVGNDASKVAEIVDKLQLTTWKGKPKAGTFADVVVPPAQIDAFREEIAGLDAVTMHEDLGASIAEEAEFGEFAAGAVNLTWFNSYHPYNDHLRWLSDLSSQYSANSEIVSSGTSLQGNNITGIHIFGSGGKGSRPAIVFHGNVHAREWISSMVVEYLAYNLVTNYASSTEIKGFVNKYDFYIFPIVNPDGFLYTQSSSGDRMWRKNRQSTSGSSCIGHDINRNWPYMWSVSGGASTNPCAEDFKGTSAADAPETQSLSNWLKKTKAAQGLKLYIDYHSYSQLFMTPYGYACDVLAPKDTELRALAKGAVAAIKAVHGKDFRYGPICSTIYKATGSSVDYVNDVVGSDYTFTTELRDTGNYGFILPASQILPSGEEAYAGIRYLLLNMN